MRNDTQKKHYILKALVVLIILFLGFVAVYDMSPTVTHVEKIVPNGANS